MRPAALLSLIFVATMPGGLVAQRVWAAATVAHAIHRAADTPPTRAARGLLLGGEGELTWGPVALVLGYAEGTLAPEPGVPDPPVLIDAFAGAWVYPLDGLGIGGGPLVRGWITPDTIARRVAWRAATRYEVPLLGRDARAHVELWAGVPDGTTSVAFGAARGGSAGLSLRLDPVALRLAYMVDHLPPAGGARGETLERLLLAAGLGRP